jgi:hypothetical protein
VALATLDQIRDRILTVVESITPTSLSDVKFRRHRAERDGNLTDWAEKNPTACLRRFIVRETSDDTVPETTTGIHERVRTRLRITVAYPQTHRYGAANALDRDDVMKKDWKSINYLVGLYGAGTFSGDHDCIPLGATQSFDRDGTVDFLIIDADFEYLRAVA